MPNEELLKNKWEPINNIDPMKRKPWEWAKIYNVKLISPSPEDLWSEYEWAYNLPNLKYVPIPDKYGEFDKANEMELRAIELRRDLFIGADLGERHVLEKEKRYIETEWVRKNLMTSY
jgi:hypothetical protein